MSSTRRNVGPQRGRRPKGRIKQVAHREVRKEQQMILRGHRISVPSHPPEFTTNPWNQVTVSFTLFVNNLGTATVFTYLRTQLGLNQNQPVVMRIHSMRIWSPLVSQNAGTSLGRITVRFLDFVRTQSSFPNNIILEEYRDYPDQVRRAAVGFVWPLSHQSHALIPETGGALVEISARPPDEPYTFYVRVWWRPGSASVPTRPEELVGKSPSESDEGKSQCGCGEFLDDQFVRVTPNLPDLHALSLGESSREFTGTPR